MCFVFSLQSPLGPFGIVGFCAKIVIVVTWFASQLSYYKTGFAYEISLEIQKLNAENNNPYNPFQHSFLLVGCMPCFAEFQLEHVLFCAPLSFCLHSADCSGAEKQLLTIIVRLDERRRCVVVLLTRNSIHKTRFCDGDWKMRSRLLATNLFWP